MAELMVRSGQIWVVVWRNNLKVGWMEVPLTEMGRLERTRFGETWRVPFWMC